MQQYLFLYIIFGIKYLGFMVRTSRLFITQYYYNTHIKEGYLYKKTIYDSSHTFA